MYEVTGRIGGKPRESATRMPIRDKYTDTVVGDLHVASEADIDEALRLATGAAKETPLAPHEPRSGMNGVTSWLSSSSTCSMSSTRTPEFPLDRQLARSSMVTRATSGGAIGPVPTPMKRRMFC